MVTEIGSVGLSSSYLLASKWKQEIVPAEFLGDPEVKVLKTDATKKERFLKTSSRFSYWNTKMA